MVICQLELKENAAGSDAMVGLTMNVSDSVLKCQSYFDHDKHAVCETVLCIIFM